MNEVGAVVIGAGVVGLATGRALARAGIETLVLDGERQFGSWTSSRNSEVIHAGIYYAPGSLKARSCVRGRELLYDYCRSRDVPFRRTGKLIFAASTRDGPALDSIMARAEAAGVTDLERLDRAAAVSLEPELHCSEAILSPSTGIVDSHAYMQALLGDLEAGGGMLVCNTRVSAVRPTPDGRWEIHVEGETGPAVVTPRVVNCAGLAAHAVAAATDGWDQALLPPLRLARGLYFSYSGRVPFRHLIYPVPEPGGLGTHLTLDLGGSARFGPDVEWIDSVDYNAPPDAERARRFAEAARRIWPSLDERRLEQGFAGIRPKLSGPDEPAADFLLLGPENHKLGGLVGLFGIESPGLTASLALAEQVVDRLGLRPSGQGMIVFD
ncbi:MAG TPA: NAD(P)/FAD-dependent oxidoreductase [Allosphingosinicella sp.]|jgi:L-2-hydroxyglutarate oxidase LhgO